MDDLISRQAAIDALDQILDRCEEIEAHLSEGDPDRTGYKMYPDYMTVRKYLYQMPSAQAKSDTGLYADGFADGYKQGKKDAQPEWIPCSERLPDESGKYLVTCRKFGKLETTWNIFYGGDHASWLWNDEIIAWMPLPEPWRGEVDGV